MRRHSIVLPFNVRQNEDRDQRYVRITLHPDCLQEFCLLLCLLFHRLIEQAIMTGKKNSYRIVLQHSSEKRQPIRATVEWEEDGFALNLSSNELEHWMCFLLRYYRDNQAAVDHIDLEADPAKRSEKAGTITLLFPEAKPPLSPDEVRRRLQE